MEDDKVRQVDVTDFVLWQKEGSEHFTGYARYFGLREYECIIKKTTKSYVVLLKLDTGWQPVGKLFLYDQPQKIRGNKEYECIGEIWTPSHTFFLLKDGDRFIGL